MASAAHNGVFGFYGERRGRPEGGLGARLKLWARRLREAFDAQGRREVDKEIGRLIAQSGGRLTDSVEREIMRRVLASH